MDRSSEEPGTNKPGTDNPGLHPDGPGYAPEIQDAVRDTLRNFSSSLDAEPLEAPPAQVWDRITAALEAAERQAETSNQPSHRRLRALPGAKWTTPLVAASVVGLAMVVGANVLGPFGQDEQAVVASDAATAQSGLENQVNQAASPRVVQAGFIPPAKKVMALSEQISSANVTQKVGEWLRQVGVQEPTDAWEMPTEDWQPSADGMTSDPQVLRDCVTKVTKVDTSQALLVVRAKVNGVDAGVLVVPEFMVDITAMDGMNREQMKRMGRQMGKTFVYVVQATCGLEAPDQDPTLFTFSFSMAR